MGSDLGTKRFVGALVYLGVFISVEGAYAAPPAPNGPPAPLPRESCPPGPRCDYDSGAGCRTSPPDTLTIFP